MLQSNDDRSSLAATTHDRSLVGVILELNAKSIREAQSFVDERLAITRKVLGAMAIPQDKQRQYAVQIGRNNHEHFIVGDNALLRTSTLPKHVVSLLPGGSTKLLPRLVGPFNVVEEVRGLQYRLFLRPEMKKHPVFYLGCLSRYVDPQEITYSHGSNVSNLIDDHATNDGAVEGTASMDTISR